MMERQANAIEENPLVRAEVRKCGGAEVTHIRTSVPPHLRT